MKEMKEWGMKGWRKECKNEGMKEGRNEGIEERRTEKRKTEKCASTCINEWT
jgi:flagellar biosynthesis/type III secretory pathway protein FliH